jgi:hypothetical protein
VPPHDRGLLARLDALVELTADRHGLALLSDGRLAAAEARVAARAAGLAAPRGQTGRAPGVAQREAVELLATARSSISTSGLPPAAFDLCRGGQVGWPGWIGPIR